MGEEHFLKFYNFVTIHFGAERHHQFAFGSPRHNHSRPLFHIPASSSFWITKPKPLYFPFWFSLSPFSLQLQRKQHYLRKPTKLRADTTMTFQPDCAFFSIPTFYHFSMKHAYHFEKNHIILSYLGPKFVYTLWILSIRILAPRCEICRFWRQNQHITHQI